MVMVNIPDISVIICTYNRADIIGEAIQSVLNQDLERDLFEVLVVNNASTDNTSDILKEFEYDQSIRWIYESNPGLSKARNSGWRNAKGRYIAYIDDDAKADVQWLRQALFCFEKIVPTPDGLTGPIYLNCKESLPDWLEGELQLPLGKLDWGTQPFKINCQKHKIVGANCFFQKSTLERLGGFNEDLGRKKKLLLSGEEVLLQKKIEDAGGSIWYHPGISVGHFVPKDRLTPAWFYKRYYWGGVSDVIMSKALFSKQKVGDRNHIEDNVDYYEVLNNSRFKQIKRLSSNLVNSLGLFSSKKKTICARIYMSYVWGYCMGVLRLFIR